MAQATKPRRYARGRHSGRLPSRLRSPAGFSAPSPRSKPTRRGEGLNGYGSPLGLTSQTPGKANEPAPDVSAYRPNRRPSCFARSSIAVQPGHRARLCVTPAVIAHDPDEQIPSRRRRRYCSRNISIGFGGIALIVPDREEERLPCSGASTSRSAPQASLSNTGPGKSSITCSCRTLARCQSGARRITEAITCAEHDASGRDHSTR